MTQPHTYLPHTAPPIPRPNHFPRPCLVKVEPVVVVAAAELVSKQFSAICIGFFLDQVVGAVEHLTWPPLSHPPACPFVYLCAWCVALAAYVTKCHWHDLLYAAFLLPQHQQKAQQGRRQRAEGRRQQQQQRQQPLIYTYIAHISSYICADALHAVYFVLGHLSVFICHCLTFLVFVFPTFSRSPWCKDSSGGHRKHAESRDVGSGWRGGCEQNMRRDFYQYGLNGTDTHTHTHTEPNLLSSFWVKQFWIWA